MGLHSEAQLDRRYIEMVRLLNLYLNHFPRHEKYGLCQMIRRVVYEVYALMIEGQKRYQKKTTLTNLDIRHEQLRMLIRLAFELDYFEFRDGTQEKEDPQAMARKRYLAISERIDEIGRMIGGWVAADRDKHATRELP